MVAWDRRYRVLVRKSPGSLDACFEGLWCLCPLYTTLARSCVFVDSLRSEECRGTFSNSSSSLRFREVVWIMELDEESMSDLTIGLLTSKL